MTSCRLSLAQCEKELRFFLWHCVCRRNRTLHISLNVWHKVHNSESHLVSWLFEFKIDEREKEMTSFAVANTKEAVWFPKGDRGRSV